jgi:outer membrane lipoprotein-sorting protein
VDFTVKLVFTMLTCLLALVPSSAFADSVDDAIASFEKLESYSVTLRSSTGEVIRYFFKKPGYIRMEFEKPHKGAVLLYDPLKKEARLRPFGSLKPFELSVSPDNWLIRSPGGHTVDESDIGALLRNVRKIRDNGTAANAGEDEINGRKTLIVEARGKGAFEAGGVNRYRVWLEKNMMLPIKVEGYGASGELLEVVLMDDLLVDPALPPDLFSF